MAKAKRPKVEDFRGLDWEKQEGEENPREAVATCNFCGASIYEGEDYWEVCAPAQAINAGDALFECCKSCGVKGGVEW